MKKIIMSVGLIAAGTASLQAAYAPGLDSMEASKLWSVSGTLRGFYDDNYNTSINKQGSVGYEVSPSVNFNVPLQQTELGLRYTYGIYYYQDRRDKGNNPYDQTHQVDLWVDHAFTERWRATVSDTLAVGQEPGLLQSGTPYRVEGNNIVNRAAVSVSTEWTRLFSTVLSYNNTFTDYQNSGTTTTNFPTQGASLAGLLNNIDQSVGLDLQWNVAPETIALIGYTFEWVNYTANEPIAANFFPPPLYYYSNKRNNRSHIGYVGLQRAILPNLNVSAKLGLQYTDNYNDSLSSSFVTPYVVSSATYTYAPGSYAQLGISHMQNSTYVATPSLGNGGVTQSQQTTSISGSVNHHITAKLLGSVIGSLQLSSFDQGQYNSRSQDLYTLGLNLNYAFNQHISGELGYNFDALQTAVPGSDYTRNRVYFGVSAAY